MATIAEIAQAAGVSKSTVSRSFTRPDSVNAETRERILAVAASMGYTPAPAKAETTGTIALFIPDIANPYYPPLVKAVQAACRRQSISLLIVDGEDDPEADAEELERIIGRVDGALIFAPRLGAGRLRALDAVSPVVLINHLTDGLPSVVLSAPEGARQAVEHLAALGHTSIAYLAGREDNYSSQVRIAAAEEAADHLGVTLRILAHAEPTYAAGVRGADLVLAEPVTAVIAHNDLMAFGCMNRLAERGVDVGLPAGPDHGDNPVRARRRRRPPHADRAHRRPGPPGQHRPPLRGPRGPREHRARAHAGLKTSPPPSLSVVPFCPKGVP